MRKFRFILCLSLLGAPLAAAEAPPPAVRLLPAKPMEPGEAVHARAADGRFDPFATPPRSEPYRPRNSSELNPADTSDRPLKKVGKWLEDRLQGVKQALAGPPEPPPEPRVGQVPGRRFVEGNPPPAPPLQRRVNAADPAFRWYGWGTATPGMNQYAPTGEYPQASAQWYLQTGATPGAFPVPTMNPYRPSPGAAPPAYAPQPPLPGTYHAAQPPAIVQPMIQQPPVQVPPRTLPPPVIPPPAAATPTPQPRVTIAETPAPGTVPPPAAPRPAPAFNPIPVPPPQIPAAASPTRQPRIFIEPQAPAKPASEDVIIPVIRGQEPTIDDSPLGTRVRETGRGLVDNVSIRESGPRQLIVSFHASTKAMAELAAKAIAAIPELKPYQVEFAATIRQP